VGNLLSKNNNQESKTTRIMIRDRRGKKSKPSRGERVGTANGRIWFLWKDTTEIPPVEPSPRDTIRKKIPN